LHELAVRAAAAEIDLRRVRQARLPFLEAATSEAIRRLAAIDRYERRVRSRRKLAMRAFAAARLSLPCREPAQICQNEPKPTSHRFCRNEPNEPQTKPPLFARTKPTHRDRHGRACHGHPRLAYFRKRADVFNKRGHDPPVMAGLSDQVRGQACFRPLRLPSNEDLDARHKRRHDDCGWRPLRVMAGLVRLVPAMTSFLR
jgi:hypothetical protein